MADDDGGADGQNLPEMQLLLRVTGAFIDGPAANRVSHLHSRTGPLTPESLAGLKDAERRDVSEEGWIRYASDGRLYACIMHETVDIHDSETHEVVRQIEHPTVDQMYWSPRGSFLVTWNRKQSEEPQLKIWDVTTGECVRSLHYKQMITENWPTLRWTEDEALLCHLVKNAINVYSGKDATTKLGTLPQKGVESFSVAPCGPPYQFATFLPVSNETPARVSIFEFPELNQAKAVKSFFKANSASIHWSPIGMGVVINAKTDVDKTNESYYGESALHLLLSDGSFSCTVPFEGNKGPVHAVEWSPQGKDFMVLQGFQPAIATLFNAVNCTPIRSFGKQPRNTIIFSPHGRFVCLGGFGNLAGEMDFWDKNKLKLMGSCQDRNGAKSYEWTPDGRHFVTAVLWPKRRVDNGFKVFTYCGELVYHETVERLAQVEVRPAREGVFPNRPMSPRLSDKRLAAVRQEKIEAEKPKSYIPPHLRGRPDAAPSLIMRREADAGAQKLGGAVPGVKATVIARDPEEVKAEKNKQRRDRAKKKKEDENKVAKEEEDRRLKEEATREQQQQEQEKLQQEARADMSDPEARARKIKQLKKKLQQVQKLRDLEASGTELDKEQAKKMATGTGLEAELAALA